RGGGGGCCGRGGAPDRPRRHRGRCGACAEGHGYFVTPSAGMAPGTVSTACQAPQSESTLESAVTSSLHGEWASAQSPLSLLARLRLRRGDKLRPLRSSASWRFQPVVMAGLALKSTVTSPAKREGVCSHSTPPT